MCIKNDSVELHFPVCDLGSTKRAKTSVRRADVCAGACDINVKAISGRRTIAIANIADDAPGASMSLFGVDAHSFKIIARSPRGFTKQAESGFDPKRTWPIALHMSAFEGKADMSLCAAHVHF